MASIVTMATDGERTVVQAPYRPGFARDARDLGGTWRKPYWVFDSRDDARVRALLARHYRWTPPIEGEPEVTVRLRISPDHAWTADAAPLVIGGVMIAQAFHRDSGARLSDHVVLINGRCDSGGSRKHWHTIAQPGSVFEIRDVPASTGRAICAEAAELAGSAGIAGTEVVDAREAERVALEAEISSLETRLRDARARRTALGPPLRQ